MWTGCSSLCAMWHPDCSLSIGLYEGPKLLVSLVRCHNIHFTHCFSVTQDLEPGAIFVSFPAAFQPSEYVLREAAHIGELAPAHHPNCCLQRLAPGAGRPVRYQGTHGSARRPRRRPRVRPPGLPVVSLESLQPGVYLENRGLGEMWLIVALSAEAGI